MAHDLIAHLPPDVQRQVLVRVKVLRPLVYAFPYAKLQDEHVLTYAMALADMPLAALQAAVLKCVKVCDDFFPTVAFIREQAELLAGEAGGRRRLTVGEAWYRAMQEVRSKASFEAPEIEDEYVAEAVRLFGWRQLQMLLESEVSIARAQFGKVYEGVLAARKEDKMNREIALLSLSAPQN